MYYSTDKEEMLSLFRQEYAYWNIDSQVHIRLQTENGRYIDSLFTTLNDLDFICLARWNSSWWGEDKRGDDADYIIVFRSKEFGYWGKHEYRCAGYSSYTFEPEVETMFLQSTSFDKFWDMCLTDNTREVLVDLLVERDLLGGTNN